jgi:hypothetical protein
VVGRSLLTRVRQRGDLERVGARKEEVDSMTAERPAESSGRVILQI